MKMKLFSRFILGIWHFIDKRIIIPITKIILGILRPFTNASNHFEKWLTKSNTILFVSLILAIVLFIFVDQKTISFNNNSAEVLKDQPVKVIYNDEAYVVEGLPKKVDITLIGSRADLYFAKQSATHDITIDLTGLKPGTHKVNVKYNQSLKSLNYQVNPSKVTVNIYPKASKTVTLSSEVINQDLLKDKLVIENVELDTDSVIVKNSEQKLADISTVKALVDIESLSKQETGEIVLNDVPLKAYDKLGNIVKTEIVPSKVSAKVIITSPSKELPIKVIPEGKIAFGKAISTINTSINTVTAYGPQKVLDNLTYVPLKVDVTDLKEDTTFKMELLNIEGIRSLSASNVTVTITLGVVSSRDVDNVAIKYRNIADDQYSIQGLSAEDVKVSVSLKGVKEVIDAITAEDIVAYLDLKGYSEGEHDVEVKVEGTDPRIEYKPKTTKVRIKIVKK